MLQIMMKQITNIENKNMETVDYILALLLRTHQSHMQK